MADTKAKQVLVKNLKTALPNWKLVRDTDSDMQGEWWYCVRSARDDEAAGTMTEGATALEALLEAATCEFKAFTPNKGLTREEIAEQETRDFCIQHGLPFPSADYGQMASQRDAEEEEENEEDICRVLTPQTTLSLQRAMRERCAPAEDEVDVVTEDADFSVRPDYLCVQVLGTKGMDPLGLRFRNTRSLDEIDDRVKLACINAAKKLLREKGLNGVKIVEFGEDAFIVGSVDCLHLDN